MAEDARHRLVEAARLHGEARSTVLGLSDAAADQLLVAWRGAIAQQDAAVDAAVDGSLSLVPRLLRSRVLQVLARGRS